MTQALATRDRYLTDFRALEEGAGEDPGWLRKLRQDAFARFSELGFPTARRGNEPWKYTNVAPIAGTAFAYPFEVQRVDAAAVRRAAPWDDGWLSLVFVDGRYSRELSSPADAFAGARVCGVAEAALAGDATLEAHVSRCAAYEDEAFTALNTAFLRDGAFVHLPEGASLSAPLHLLFVSSGGPGTTVSYPRTLIVAGVNSELTVIESYASLAPAPGLTDAVTEIVLDAGASVDHNRLLLESMEALHVGVSRVRQGEDSRFSSTSYIRGAALGRNDFRVELAAPGGSSFLNGLYVTTGTQHIDNYLNIEHIAPHTTSRLYYRGILDDQSRAVFGGTVLVRPGADKTDAHQEDKNLILSPDAEVDSKPSLEIYADDVICGHGATAGTVAEEAIFYMLSRGLDLETATSFLIQGFAAEIIDTVKVDALRARLSEITVKALKGVHFQGLQS